MNNYNGLIKTLLAQLLTRASSLCSFAHTQESQVDRISGKLFSHLRQIFGHVELHLELVLVVGDPGLGRHV